MGLLTRQGNAGYGHKIGDVRPTAPTTTPPTLGNKSVDICCRVDHNENMNDALTPPMTRPLPYGLSHDELEFEPLTIEEATDLNLRDMLQDMSIDPDINDPTYRLIFDAALALYEKQCHSPTYDFTDRPGLLAACLHSAQIWHFG